MKRLVCGLVIMVITGCVLFGAGVAETKRIELLDGKYKISIDPFYGRLREDNVFDLKFIALSHNTVRGAAGGSILMAELLKVKGFIN